MGSAKRSPFLFWDGPPLGLPREARRHDVTILPAGDGGNDEERLGALGDGFRQQGIGRLVGEIFFAGKESDEGPALLGRVIADCPAQHWVLGFEGVQHRALRHGACHFEFHFSVNFGQGPQMLRKHDTDHKRSSAAKSRIVPGTALQAAISTRARNPGRCRSPAIAPG